MSVSRWDASLPTGPPAIVFLSEAKDLACYRSPHCPLDHPAIVFLSEAKDLAC